MTTNDINHHTNNEENNHEENGKKSAKYNVNEVERATWETAEPEKRNALVSRIAQIAAVALNKNGLFEEQNGY